VHLLCLLFCEWPSYAQEKLIPTVQSWFPAVDPATQPSPFAQSFGGANAQPTEESDKYVINIKQIAKFVVGLGDKVAPTDVEEGMRVGSVHLLVRLSSWQEILCLLADRVSIPSRVDRTNYKIQIPLPPKIDPSVTMMQVEEKPDVTYSDVGGCKEQIEKLREVVELPLLEVSFRYHQLIRFLCSFWRHLSRVQSFS
jgi:26S proteasome regulatory subunit T1